METILKEIATLSSDKIEQVYTAVSKEEYTQGEIDEPGLTSKNIFTWMKDGYLLKPRGEEKANSWLKFTFLDYVWVKLLLYMSDLGVAKKTNLKRLGQQDGNVKKIVRCLADGGLSGVTLEYKPSVEARITNPLNQAAYDTLAAIIIDSVLAKAIYRIRIYKEGVCQLLREGKVVASSDLNQTVDTESFVQFALSDIFIDFIAQQILEGKGKDLMWKGLLTIPEGTLVEHLRYVGIVEKITVELVGREPIKMFVAKGVTKEDARLLAKHMSRGDYTKIVYVIAKTTSSFTKSDEDAVVE